MNLVKRYPKTAAVLGAAVIAGAYAYSPIVGKVASAVLGALFGG